MKLSYVYIYIHNFCWARPGFSLGIILLSWALAFLAFSWGKKNYPVIEGFEQATTTTTIGMRIMVTILTTQQLRCHNQNNQGATTTSNNNHHHPQPQASSTRKHVFTKQFLNISLRLAQLGVFLRMGPSVAVLTFYKGQLEELMKAQTRQVEPLGPM